MKPPSDKFWERGTAAKSPKQWADWDFYNSKLHDDQPDAGRLILDEWSSFKPAEPTEAARKMMRYIEALKRLAPTSKAWQATNRHFELWGSPRRTEWITCMENAAKAGGCSRAEELIAAVIAVRMGA